MKTFPVKPLAMVFGVTLVGYTSAVHAGPIANKRLETSLEASGRFSASRQAPLHFKAKKPLETRVQRDQRRLRSRRAGRPDRRGLMAQGGQATEWHHTCNASGPDGEDGQCDITELELICGGKGMSSEDGGGVTCSIPD